jgi:nitrite reductase/ring-hydroxylating ferredoxin subunit
LNKHLIFENKSEAEKAIPLNSIRKIKIEERIYALANTPKGFRTFSRSCPHAGADLSQGRLNYLGEIVCPLHAYRFNFLDGEEDSRRCPSIKIYQTFWEEDKLYVSLN